MKKFVFLFVCLAPLYVHAQEQFVTVYTSNLGVVSETRRLEFHKGLGELAFTDVPSAIDASTVRFSLANSNARVTILEQNYVFDLVSPEQLYAKYVDNDIELIDKDGRFYSGMLLAHGSGAVTLLEKSGRVKVVLLSNITEVNFPSLPEGLITRPTLMWKYRSDFEGQADCNVSYQTRGLNWKAEYVGLLDESETNLKLSSWASINNTSGKTYKNARLKLVAGDIGRIQPKFRGGRGELFAMAKVADAVGFEEKEFFEYHLYTLPRKATLANNQTKQISLFEPADTEVKKVFRYRPDINASKVEVNLKFTNSKSGGLGMPLPAGRVRLFKADSDGSLVLLGEDAINHTPIDEEVILRVGYAFDIVAEQRLMDQNRISQKVEERSFELELRNRKKEAVEIEVEKKLYGDWELIESSIPGVKKDAGTLQFVVTAPAGEKTIISFRIRTKLR